MSSSINDVRPRGSLASGWGPGRTRPILPPESFPRHRAKAAGLAAWKDRCRSFRRAQRGSTSLEFGLIGSAFFLLVLAAIQFSLYFFTLQAVRSVTNMAIRAAMTSNANPTSCSATYTYSTSSPPSPLDGSKLQVTSSITCPATSTDGKTHISVTTTYPFTFFLPALSANSGTISDNSAVVF